MHRHAPRTWVGKQLPGQGDAGALRDRQHLVQAVAVEGRPLHLPSRLGHGGKGGRLHGGWGACGRG